MFTAKFNENESCAKVRGLWQWSFGQKLKIVGVPVSEHTIEVHFSEDGNEEALRVLANVEDGAIISDIPNELYVPEETCLHMFISRMKQRELRCEKSICLYVHERNHVITVHRKTGICCNRFLRLRKEKQMT